jgi:DNA (cytosine-5)-methyltransferase 1
MTTAINYLSVCSGIEAATVAWHPLGWKAVAFSEIEKFPSSVLRHHYPEVENLGDMTKFNEWKINEPIDLLVGGTPCQAFSIAGLRKGLDDPRGNLTLTFLAMARKFRPRWIVWENVPGVLSDKTNTFGAFLGGLAELGYGCAYRVLDAQYFGVAQRRRRVFVVGYLGDWQRAAAVLFEPESLRGDPAPIREAGQRAAGTISARTAGGGGLGTDFEIGGGLTVETAHTLKADGFDASEDGTGRRTPLWPCEVAPTLNAHFGDKQGLEDQHALNGGGCSSPEISRTLNAGAMGRCDAETETLIPCPKNP